MESIITVNNEYNSLDKLYEQLREKSSLTCTKDYDKWEMRIDANGQMEQCIILKKSGMHGVKLFFTEANKVKVNHIIPSAIMNAYFGKSQKKYQNVLEIVTGKIRDIVLAPSQNKAFEDLTQEIKQFTM